MFVKSIINWCPAGIYGIKKHSFGAFIVEHNECYYQVFD